MGEYIWKLTQKELHYKMNFAYEQGIANERERILDLIEDEAAHLIAKGDLGSATLVALGKLEDMIEGGNK
jgi:hypothetical protein